MYEINYDRGKNRLHLKLEGMIHLEEAKAFRKESEAYHKKMAAGGSYVLDATKLKTLPQDSSAEFQEIRDHAVRHGVGRGAVVLEDKILAMQTKRMAKQIEGFEEDYFDNMKEALAFLDK